MFYKPSLVSRAVLQFPSAFQELYLVVLLSQLRVLYLAVLFLIYLRSLSINFSMALQRARAALGIINSNSCSHFLNKIA